MCTDLEGWPHVQRTNSTPVPITIVTTTTAPNDDGPSSPVRYPIAPPTEAPCADGVHLGCAPEVLVTRRVLVGYSVKTVVVPSLPTEVVVRVDSVPWVVVVVETVALVVVLASRSRVTSEAVLSLAVEEGEDDSKKEDDDSAEWVCDEDVATGEVGRSAGVGITAGIGEVGKDAGRSVGDDRGTSEAGKGAGKDAGWGERDDRGAGEAGNGTGKGECGT